MNFLETRLPAGARCRQSATGLHSHVAFNYQHARPTKTALDVYTERVGVCRDYQHLAITFAAPSTSGTLRHRLYGRHRRTRGLPMDFSAWFEVWLDGQWWTFDARNNNGHALAAF